MDFIRIDKQNHVTTVTLNRPEVMNAINPAMHHELQAAFDAFAADADQRVCVVTGAGERAFCAGSDLKGAAEKGFDKQDAYPKNGYAGIAERFDLDKPIIAAVNGVALGGGFEIVLACDIVIASEKASFGLPEPLVGAVALGGGLHRLARQVGLKQAMGLVLTAKRFDAQEALHLGLVNEVVAADQLLAVTGRWCDEIARCAPQAIRASKDTMMRGLDEPSLSAALRNQEHYASFARWRAGDDFKEGPRAFAEKRKPIWTGH